MTFLLLRLTDNWQGINDKIKKKKTDKNFESSRLTEERLEMKRKQEWIGDYTWRTKSERWPERPLLATVGVTWQVVASSRLLLVFFSPCEEWLLLTFLLLFFDWTFILSHSLSSPWLSWQWFKWKFKINNIVISLVVYVHTKEWVKGGNISHEQNLFPDLFFAEKRRSTWILLQRM